MESSQHISYLISFSAGFLSFISPCVLPIIPSYLSYITGLSFKELTSPDDRSKARKVALTNSLVFILGFSTIFILLGASATLMGRVLISYLATVRQIGGLIIIFFGLSMMGLIKPAFLMKDVHFKFYRRPVGYLGSYLVGVAFGAGWTPCVGPILGSILMYASASVSVLTGIELLAVYSLGLGLPLFLASLGIQSFLSYYKKATRYLWLVSGTSGVFLIAVGILIFTNSLARLTAFLYEFGIGWDIGQ